MYSLHLDTFLQIHEKLEAVHPLLSMSSKRIKRLVNNSLIKPVRINLKSSLYLLTSELSSCDDGCIWPLGSGWMQECCTSSGCRSDRGLEVRRSTGPCTPLCRVSSPPASASGKTTGKLSSYLCQLQVQQSSSLQYVVLFTLVHRVSCHGWMHHNRLIWPSHASFFFYSYAACRFLQMWTFYE